MQAVITAGGKGTRLSPITNDLIPKPLVKLGDKTLIDHLVDCLIANHIIDIIIIVGHLGEQIEAHLGDGSQKKINIRYIYEKEPLGTAGGLFYIKDLIHEEFVLLYADILMDVDLNRMLSFHKSKQAEATILVHPNSHPFDSDLVINDPNGRVLKFDYKESKRDYDYDNCVSAGIYIFEPILLKKISKPDKLSLEKDVITGLIETGAAVFAYRSPEYVKDAGTPERLAIAEKEYETGVVKERNLSNKHKAIFIDRDGTVNVYKGMITSPDQIELLPGAAEAIKKINSSGYLAIIITNQPVVARGDCTYDLLELIHKRLITLLGREGAYIDDLRFCPHHPDRGYEGEVAALKIDCNCRKPKTGMVDECVEKYNIIRSESWFIGDTYRDVQTGVNCGLKTVLLSSGEHQYDNRSNIEPTIRCDSLLEAVTSILGEK